MTSIPTTQDLAAELAFLRTLLADHYATQIDAGAVLREEVAAHIRNCAARTIDDHPHAATLVESRAKAMIARLPAGWAEGDWQDPA